MRKTSIAKKGKKTEGEKIKEAKSGKFAIIRVRGKVRVKSDIKDTMRLLKLTRVNHCVVVDDIPQIKGMIKKINDYVTWGEISPESLEGLLQNKGELIGHKKLTDPYLKNNTNYSSIKDFVKAFFDNKTKIKDIPSLKPVFRLHPPRRGYEDKGIKKPFSIGGALGYRGSEINKLIEKMI